MTTGDTLTPAHHRVLEALDTQALVEHVVHLVRTPSVTGTDAESELQDEMARELGDLGMDVDLWKLDLDALAADPDYPGVEAPRAEGYGLVGVSAGVSRRSSSRGTSTSCRSATCRSGAMMAPSAGGSPATRSTGAAPST